MLRKLRLALCIAFVVWALTASAASGQGSAPETVRVKIVTKENMEEFLKQLNKMGVAQKLEFVNDESRYVYWIEYTVTDFERWNADDFGLSRPKRIGELTYKDVNCSVYGLIGVNGGYLFGAHGRGEDKVAKEIVKLIAKDMRRKVLLPPEP
jgi:hypothetical protein